MALIILQQILVMALYMLIGFLLYKGKKITDAGSKTLANMLAFAVIPAMLINSFLVECTPEKLIDFGWSFLLGTGTVVLAIVIASLIFRGSGVERFAAAFSNAGFMGLPLIKASIGDEGVFFLVGLLIPFNVIQWIYGCPILEREAEKARRARGEAENAGSERRSAGALIRHLLLNPMVLASAAGFLLFVSGLGVKLPVIARSCISGVAALNAPLAMMVLGVYLAQSDIKELFLAKRLYVVSAVRLLVIPLLTLLVLALLPVDSRIRMTMMIAASAPVGANVAVYSQIYGADYVYACRTVTQSTLLSILVMPLVIFLAGYVMPV